jgi:REP element-mobilizing transposase RayT
VPEVRNRYQHQAKYFVPQSQCRILVHAIFTTRHRIPFLIQNIRDDLHPYMGGILNNIGCKSIRIGGVEDHVHALFGLSRTFSIGEAMKALKGTSTTWLKDSYPECGKFSWQPGYAASSVDPLDFDGLVHYIDHQEEHHRKVSTLEEIERFLQERGMEPWEED